MVRKLFKHEFYVWIRLLWAVAAVILVMACANRVIQFFETDSGFYYIFFVLSLLSLFITMVIALAVPSFYAAIRFYKNLFSGEGYLSFTLPVTPAQHLWVKSLTATVMTLAVGAVCVLCCLVVISGDVFAEVCNVGIYYANRAKLGQLLNCAGVVAEFLVLIPVSVFAGHFLIYGCVCLGQLFRKNRILGAFGIYFIYYILSQIFSGAISFGIEILAICGVLDPVGEFISQHPFAGIHSYMIVITVLVLAQSVVCFVICNQIMKRKLNLE